MQLLRNQDKITHGLSGSRFYNIYNAARSRCRNKSQHGYPNYSGRGIKFNFESFEQFKETLYEPYLIHLMRHGETNTTLDRIDSNGDYEPSNCRWATRKEQAANSRPRRERTHCLKGHELTPENNYIHPKKGSKNCRICRKSAALRSLARKRG